MTAARLAVRSVDDSLPPYNIRTFDEIRASYIADRRFAMVLMLAFAGLTGGLAAIGLYGVMSYLVQLRVREIGIRVALGATPAGVLRETMRGGLSYAVPGIVIGTGARGRLVSGSSSAASPVCSRPTPRPLGSVPPQCSVWR